ncbi:hypothetical protein K435DRAFT_833957 [Dendrothele bispora CBS 962.96]|uniref:SH3 domain-containing protein n=1 Tax=Dendrothele bispora (strain CBS 962.96) TaxID=1314807 RepID=A0A4S8MVC0_DENBC|nr:hypothetical protein K435DRAFT_833957 [Dendrothele bispora CBS 962.96]
MPEPSVKHPPPPGLPISSSNPTQKHAKTPSTSTPTPLSATAFTPTTPTPHNLHIQSAQSQVIIPSLPSPTSNGSNNNTRLSQTYNLTQSLNSPLSSLSSKSRPTSLSGSSPAAASSNPSSNPPTPSSPAFFHKQNRDSTASNLSGVSAISSLSSSRPAPPSPAISRRTSGIGGAIVDPAVPLARSSSNRSRSARESLALGLSPSKEEEDLVPTQPNTPAITPSHTFASTTSTIVSGKSQQQQPRLHLVPIKIRDFAYPHNDARFFGLGFLASSEHVPKQNRIRVLNKALMGEDGYRLWREERRRLRDQMRQAQAATQPRSAGPGDRNSTSSLAWSSASEASEDDFDPDPSDDFDDLEDDEDGWGSGRSGGGGGAWGGSSGFQFGKGRFSWGPSASSSASNSNPSGAYPSQKDLARNFAGMEDSPATSSSESEEDSAYYDASETQDGKYYEDSTDEDVPLLPGFYRALYAFDPEGSAEVGLVEDQIVKVVGRGGGVGWAVVVVGNMGDDGVWRNDLSDDGKEKHGLVPESYLEAWRLDDEDTA